MYKTTIIFIMDGKIFIFFIFKKKKLNEQNFSIKLKSARRGGFKVDDENGPT